MEIDLCPDMQTLFDLLSSGVIDFWEPGIIPVDRVRQPHEVFSCPECVPVLGYDSQKLHQPVTPNGVGPCHQPTSLLT